MNFDKVFNIAGLIVGVAMVTTIVSRPNSARVFQALGAMFSDSIESAMALRPRRGGR